jgi:hypothetical protein
MLPDGGNMKRSLLMVMALGFSAAACSKAQGAYENSYDTAAQYENGVSRSLSAAPAAAGGSEWTGTGYAQEVQAEAPDFQNQNLQNEKKLIKSAVFRIKVEDFDSIDTLITALLDQHHGYASSATVRENFRNYTLKIPSLAYEDVVKGLHGIGAVMYYNETVEDATIRFYDMDGRLRTKQELLGTFRSYLRQAKTVDEIMTVEKRIAELQQEIDWLGSQLSSLAHLVDYATIELEVYGPSSGNASYSPGAGERIGALFKSFGAFLSTVLVVLTGLIIFGIPCVLILAVLAWLLFGRIGLLKKLWRLVMERRQKTQIHGV